MLVILSSIMCILPSAHAHCTLIGGKQFVHRSQTQSHKHTLSVVVLLIDDRIPAMIKHTCVLKKIFQEMACYNDIFLTRGPRL